MMIKYKPIIINQPALLFSQSVIVECGVKTTNKYAKGQHTKISTTEPLQQQVS